MPRQDVNFEDRGQDLVPQSEDLSYFAGYGIPEEDFEAVDHAIRETDIGDFCEMMGSDYGLTVKEAKDLFDSRHKHHTPPNLPPGVGFSSPFNPQPFFSNKGVHSTMEVNVGDHVTTAAGTEALEVVKVNKLNGKVVVRDWQGRTQDLPADEVQLVASNAVGPASFGPIVGPSENPLGVNLPFGARRKKKKGLGHRQLGQGFGKAGSYERGNFMNRGGIPLDKELNGTVDTDTLDFAEGGENTKYPVSKGKPGVKGNDPKEPKEDLGGAGGKHIRQGIDYPDRSAEGLEGPFHMPDGRTYYYDKKEGAYWDPTTDIFVPRDYVPWEQSNLRGVRQSSSRDSLGFDIQGALLISKRVRRPIQSFDANLKNKKPQQWQQGFNDFLAGKNIGQTLQGDDQAAYMDGQTEAASQKKGAQPQATTTPGQAGPTPASAGGMPVGASRRRLPLSQALSRTIGDRLYDFVDRAKNGQEAEATSSLGAFLSEHNLGEYLGDNKSAFATTAEISSKVDPDDIDIFLQKVEAGEAYTTYDAEAADTQPDLEMTDFSQEPDLDGMSLGDLEGEGQEQAPAEEDQSLAELEAPEEEAPMMPPGQVPTEPNLEQ
jgi:hypothetical protein